MRITFADRLTRKTVNEGSSFSIGVKFWDDSAEDWVAQTPTTISYRIDLNSPPYCSTPIKDWTTVTPGSSVTITPTYTDTAIINTCQPNESHVLTVKTDAGLSTQYQQTYVYSVKNLPGQP